ncbi:tRNA-splicing endonuclease-like protein subunit sen34 [Dothidotthia symphoricarpi CBS 119687]|uniref:tRNA-splicing endonuclease subunit Sen34 n=1 Tax=Dothidotthia symphoricarpi CBS 119687 TaxID=1392245 RepID=A0A6A6AED6_9PLEO|nr:tRNA-splicing endonuclease-like protein subunit sen34 [Dothidotthia symphoricarpi CBS 119687]KAF2129277.1 tRNA-splicing endonuclease-like protein subunit sen34 [Dothidotthia symphoricarpi CBS 119687]
MAPASAPTQVTEPFPISCIAGRYLLFDVDVVSHCRRKHNMCGMLVGTIPNMSQQNVFLGIPLELMPEEARVLVENGNAYVVDDVEVHRQGFIEMSREDRLNALEEMDRRGIDAAKESMDKAERKKDKALKEKGLRREVLERQNVGSVAENTVVDETSGTESSSDAGSDLGFIMKGSTFLDSSTKETRPSIDASAAETTLFDSRPASPSPSVNSTNLKGVNVSRQYVTPTTSYPLLATPPQDTSLPLPPVPASYPLFRYLHSRGYFHMPGLRFGCNYSVYPGDPLRYHSHFLATGMDWDREFDLLDVVGGGRLGTGTKKAYMIGGGDPKDESVRAFSIEWAAM